MILAATARLAPYYERLIASASAMRLHLHSHNPGKLRTVVQLVLSVRKRAVFRFLPRNLVVFTPDGRADGEPQVWCQIKLKLVFAHADIRSLRDNVVELELVADQVAQVLKMFDQDMAALLSIKLVAEAKTAPAALGAALGAPSTTLLLSGLRLRASLCFSYAAPLAVGSDLTRTFKIPVKVCGRNSPLARLEPPPVSRYSLAVELAPAFIHTYSRLEKFRKLGEALQISVGSDDPGMAFRLEDDGRCVVTLWYKDELKRVSFDPQADDLRHAVITGADGAGAEGAVASVKIGDWLGTRRVLLVCRTNFLMFAGRDCVVHLWLDDDNDDVEIKYYLSGYRYE